VCGGEMRMVLVVSCGNRRVDRTCSRCSCGESLFGSAIQGRGSKAEVQCVGRLTTTVRIARSQPRSFDHDFATTGTARPCQSHRL
jgi:hypothetical protein